jgi:hypothetical protein
MDFDTLLLGFVACLYEKHMSVCMYILFEGFVDKYLLETGLLKSSPGADFIIRPVCASSFNQGVYVRLEAWFSCQVKIKFLDFFQTEIKQKTHRRIQRFDASFILLVALLIHFIEVSNLRCIAPCRLHSLKARETLSHFKIDDPPQIWRERLRILRPAHCSHTVFPFG